MDHCNSVVDPSVTEISISVVNSSYQVSNIADSVCGSFESISESVKGSNDWAVVSSLSACSITDSSEVLSISIDPVVESPDPISKLSELSDAFVEPSVSVAASPHVLSWV